jgi:hypothetical protein
MDAAAAWAVAHGWCVEAGRGTGIPGLLDPTGWVDLRRHGGAQLQLLLAPDGEDQHRPDVLDAGL